MTELDQQHTDQHSEAPPQHVSPLVRRFTGGEPDRNTQSNPALLLGLLALVVYGFISGGWPLMVVIGALAVSVVLHEAGHYFTAKAAGVKVTEFFVGMGPRLWSFRRGETEYGLKLFPIAAYVRPLGQTSLDEVDPEEEHRTVRSKSFWRRFSIFFGGPAMNLLIAVACIWALLAFNGVPKSGLFTAREEPTDWTIESIVDGSAAASAGLQAGDRIVGFDGQSIGKFSELHTLIAQSAGKAVTLDVERGSSHVEVHTTIGTRDGDPGTGFLGVQSKGIEPPLTKSSPIAAVPEAFGELARGSVESIKAIGSKFSPAGLIDLGDRVAKGGDQGPTVEAPSGATTSGSSATSSERDDDRFISIIGAVGLGADAARSGWAPFVFIIGLINLFLGLVNLLPLLPFDGGHIAVAVYEQVRSLQTGRKYRADITKLLPLTYAVVMVFAFIGLSSMYLDIVAPIGS